MAATGQGGVSLREHDVRLGLLLVLFGVVVGLVAARFVGLGIGRADGRGAPSTQERNFGRSITWCDYHRDLRRKPGVALFDGTYISNTPSLDGCMAALGWREKSAGK